MIQKTDADEAQLMPAALPKGFFPPEPENENNAADPPHDADPSHGVENPPSAISEDTLRKVLAKMLDDKIEEVFDALKRDAGNAASTS
jgi:hypothetical protein